MTIDQLITELQAISAAGDGGARLLIEEEGGEYAGYLNSVDTILTTGAKVTVTLLGEHYYANSEA